MHLRHTGPTDLRVRKVTRMLVSSYHVHGVPLWRAVAERLACPRRQRTAVNISRIARHAIQNDTVVIPGKVLGAGSLQHPVTVAALGFTREAKQKIEGIGGRCLTIEELVKLNPDGKNVRLMR